jgi:glycosidase
MQDGLRINSMKSNNKIFLIILSIGSFTLFSCRTSTENNKIVNKGYTQYGKPFANIPETKDIIMYEVNLRAFSQSGDIPGVLERLDSIKALNVNVIWLMPIHPIGEIKSVNSPYCVQNYLEVDPEFGTLEDLRALTDQAHAKNMAVILDWVANHTAWDNPWIDSTSWYTQENGEIISPKGTNWQDVADLNYDNPEMRLAMIDALKYWLLEANVDGYRCDAADFVPFDFWQQAIDALSSIPNRALILLAEGARGDHFTAGFQLNYAWDFYHKLKRVFSGDPASGLYTTHISEYQDIPDGKHKLRFTTNHDESAWDATPVALFNGIDGALAASDITLYMGGVPLIYGSQEVGTADPVPFFSQAPIDWDQNPGMYRTYKNIMTFYAQSDVLIDGNLTDYSNSTVVCFTRKSAAEEVLVITNTRDRHIDFSLPDDLQHSSWTDAFSNRTITLDTAISLGSYAYKILENTQK